MRKVITGLTLVAALMFAATPAFSYPLFGGYGYGYPSYGYGGGFLSNLFGGGYPSYYANTGWGNGWGGGWGGYRRFGGYGGWGGCHRYGGWGGYRGGWRR